MKRPIIQIDEQRCNGCCECVISCAEGAIQIIDGKAKVVKDEFCDGLGACIGTCPVGALKIIEREAPEFDEEAAMAHVKKSGQSGETHSPLLKTPVIEELPVLHGGCPGSRMRVQETRAQSEPTLESDGLPPSVLSSDLAQWPVQLHLVPPKAPFFEGRELVIMSTCAPLASADVHWRFLRGRGVVVACPKLDRTESYVEKLSRIFESNTIPRVLVVRMTVPCCGGLTHMVHQAMSGCYKEIPVKEVIVHVDGTVREPLASV